MNIAAIAINDPKLIRKIVEVLPESLQTQIKDTYPEYFQTHKVGNKYMCMETGEVHVLATEYGHVALVNVETGYILSTIIVSNLRDITNSEMEEVYSGRDFELVEESI